MQPPTPELPDAPDDAVLDAARATLRARLDAVLLYLPKAALHHRETAEHVHRLRVSSRRAAVAVHLYQSLLDREQERWMKQALRTVRKCCDTARDVDVMSERLPATEAVAIACARLRLQAQPAIVATYEELYVTGELATHAEQLLDSLAWPEREAPPAFRGWAAAQLRATVTPFLTAEGNIDPDDAETLHHFRIQAKKLRYALELLEPAIPLPLRDVLYPQLKTLQGKLGAVNDHHTALIKVAAWRERLDGDPAEPALAEFLDQERAAFESARAAFATWWTPERARALRERFEATIRHAEITSGRDPV